MFTWFKSKKNLAALQAQMSNHGYVGKTRWQPDFVKLNVTTREAIALDHWIREGFAAASRQGAWLEPQGHCIFFMAGSDEEAHVVGMIQPSLDSHQRSYPFTSFLLAKPSNFKQHPACLLLRHGQIFSLLNQLTIELCRAKDKGAMNGLSRGLNDLALSLQPPGDLGQLFDRFRRLPMSFLWQGISLQEGARARLIQCSCNLFSQLSERGNLREHTGIRFPMPGMADEAIWVAAFWLHLMAMRVADGHWRPWFFYHWGNERQAPGLIVFMRPAAASVFSALWGAVPDRSQVMDIEQLSLTTKPGDGARQLADLDNMSMYDALRRWCKC